jgi:hypothetical protein
MPKCVIATCKETALESHHIFPTALGGSEDGPQIWLCPTCHRKVHIYASRLFRGVAINEPDERWLRAAYPVINRIVRALREAENNPLDQAPARIVLEITKKDLRMIHLRKMDKGFRSLPAYILALIKADFLVR